MEDKQQHIQQLYGKWIDNTASQQEIDELYLLLETHEIKEVLDVPFRALWRKEETEDIDVHHRHQAILAAIIGRFPVESSPARPVHRIHFLKTTWFRYAAAILVVMSVCIYLWNTQKSKPVPAEIIAAHDVQAPDMNRATLTLANGKKIFLDSTAKGLLAVEGQTNIAKNANGQLVYDKRISGETIQYNELSVPRGSQVAGIVLSDGSKVFLNAASSLKYPVAFNSSEKKVEIIGEAYFEISKDAKRKFIVISRGIQTEVLGTTFNVNAYPDEIFSKVTLIQGSVKVSNGKNAAIIKPGEAFINGSIVKTDINQDIAWQKGMFVFNNTDLPSILRQVSRWYNVEVIYKEAVPSRNFGGILSRRNSLSDVVKMLQSNDISCVIQGNKIIIGR